MTIHRLKTCPPYFEAVWDGVKPFDLRRSDRDFQSGDGLMLAEWSEVTGYTGRVVHAKITTILRDVPDWGLVDGFCIMGLKVLSREANSAWAMSERE